MAQPLKEFDCDVIDILIGEEVHPFLRYSWVNFLSFNQRSGILHTGLYVLHCNVWIVPLDDLIEGNPLLDQLKDTIYRDSCPGNAGQAKMDICVNCDSAHGMPSLGSNFVSIA